MPIITVTYDSQGQLRRVDRVEYSDLQTGQQVWSLISAIRSGANNVGAVWSGALVRSQAEIMQDIASSTLLTDPERTAARAAFDVLPIEPVTIVTQQEYPADQPVRGLQRLVQASAYDQQPGLPAILKAFIDP